MKRRVEYLTKISQIPHLSPEEKDELDEVVKKFSFKANGYYLSLINWKDKADPIRRMVIPIAEELEDEGWGRVDPSDEARYTVAPGLQHKYKDTALFLLTDSCGGQCRYCFRKRIFLKEKENEILRDYHQALQYIKDHQEITNVLLTGGDPLQVSTENLQKVLASLREIDHVQIIRVGTKMLAYNPFRIIDDPELPKVLEEFSTVEKRIYFVVHFNHPRELTKEAIRGVNILLKSGVILCNQSPLLAGINDNPLVLAELLKKLSSIGVIPYYVFQCRPAIGNKPYSLPLVRAYQVFEGAKKEISGLDKRVKFVMSHKIGKIEVVGLDKSYIYFKQQRAPNSADNGKLMVARRNDNGYWFDDFEIVSESRI